MFDNDSNGTWSELCVVWCLYTLCVYVCMSQDECCNLSLSQKTLHGMSAWLVRKERTLSFSLSLTYTPPHPELRTWSFPRIRQVLSKCEGGNHAVLNNTVYISFGSSVVRITSIRSYRSYLRSPSSPLLHSSSFQLSLLHFIFCYTTPCLIQLIPVSQTLCTVALPRRNRRVEQEVNSLRLKD